MIYRPPNRLHTKFHEIIGCRCRVSDYLYARIAHLKESDVHPQYSYNLVDIIYEIITYYVICIQQYV